MLSQDCAASQQHIRLGYKELEIYWLIKFIHNSLLRTFADHYVVNLKHDDGALVEYC
ncbi:hypothetical protein DAPPUDRAFT_233148 [Daphnia pulex]|uniref:Uncharacterized protein n=1 Tax=Daphnia pulex TaxID=6669 RepID=E9FTD0_DAPPU|nr:hypothetical protein DAPPUDRAFT_233148 [Daphnia pulex]|eukprot:EFX89343.1 hypothetical protein DAPPUDRAFT_233148 [Daphnia pulex]